MLRVELAETPSSWERGLMFRKKLDQDSGMLFKFQYPQKLNFWGTNTLIPLDIAFISSDGIIKKITHINPNDNKVVSSDDNCNMSIEANLNYFSDNKIHVGDKISLERITDDVGKVIFLKKHKGLNAFALKNIR